MRDDREDFDEPAQLELETSDVLGAARSPRVRIHNYRVGQLISEGGMGEVYEAEQEEPVRRHVALKLIKLGMDSREVLARFESERQALALMSHPNIARVFDAGTTEQGRPYFAMEFVRGESITDYCDNHKLKTRERLELFVHVCEGVHHAHQKGIIHRDIKPGNVLVEVQDDRPIPKIIDFGIAKATGPRLTEKTMFTEMGQLVGTPEYMSPEQAEMRALDIDTRTDVYSLGVLLYELLTGGLPFDTRRLRQSGFDQYRRMIIEEEPAKPSARISHAETTTKDIAVRRSTDVRSLRRQLRGDLDWIVMKALEKERKRRYASASELALDVARYLRDEPVTACPPSNLYRLRKFTRRHRTGVAFGVVLIALLSGVAVNMAVQKNRLAREKDQVQLERELAQEVSAFLVELFDVPDPLGDSITASEILALGSKKLEAWQGRPLVRARLMHTMGLNYGNLGLYDQALFYVERALRDYETALGKDDPQLAEILLSMGNLHVGNYQYAEARPYYERAKEMRTAAFAADDPAVLSSLNVFANWLWAIGDFDQALDYHEQVLEVRRQTLEPDHPDLATSLHNLATMSMKMGDLARARPLFERALAIRESDHGSDDSALAQTLEGMADLLAARGRYTRARELYERALGILSRSEGPDHLNVATTLFHMAMLDIREGKMDEAKQNHDLAIIILERNDATERASTLYLEASLAAISGAKYDALGYLRRAVEANFVFPRGDPNLQSLWDTPEFEALAAKAREPKS